MRTSSRIAFVLMVGVGLVLRPALAFDGPKSPTDTPVLAFDGVKPGDTPLSPAEAFRFATKALKAGDLEKALLSLQYAAEKGHPLAQWKLGRMFADGDGVKQNDLRAFEYFSIIANAHADDSPNGRQARFVANAFVALGLYYLDGIPNTRVKADPNRAREMFAYAASYFGDADAQYYLARLYLEGRGAPRDPKVAVRWLVLAAHKGQYQAQALLGSILFEGKVVPRQAARGLMWLTLAHESARKDDKWISELYDAAMKQATPDESAICLRYLETYLSSRR